MIANGKRDRSEISPLFFLCLALLGVVPCLHPTTAYAGPPDRSKGEQFSYEVRTQFFSPSVRRSSIDTQSRFSDEVEYGLHFSSGLGFRLVGKEGHALAVDGEYRHEIYPGISLDGVDLVLFRFGVAHVGYAYRFIAHQPRSKWRRRRFAISPHIALAMGAAGARDDYSGSGIPQRSPTVGVRGGVDVDVHVRRVFFGWRFAYEFLHHTRGSLTRSSFFVWNLIPLFRIGVNLGRPVTGRRARHP